MSRLINWTPEILAMLGKVTDAEVARVLGCHITTVWAKRRALNVPKFIKFDLAAVLLLGTMPDAQLAKMMGVHRKTALSATASSTASGSSTS